jgi:hypothetical protein
MKKSLNLLRKSMDFWWAESQRLFDQLLQITFTNEGDFDSVNLQYNHAQKRYKQARDEYFKQYN